MDLLNAICGLIYYSCALFALYAQLVIRHPLGQLLLALYCFAVVWLFIRVKRELGKEYKNGKAPLGRVLKYTIALAAATTLVGILITPRNGKK